MSTGGRPQDIRRAFIVNSQPLAYDSQKNRMDEEHPAKRRKSRNQLRALLVTAPEELRAQLHDLSTAKLVATAARFRPGDPKDLPAMTKLAMRSVARRHRRLSARQAVEKLPWCPLSPQIGHQTRRLWGVSSPI